MFYEVFFLILTQGLLTLTALNDMTWLESFSRCKVIGEKDSRSLDEFRASYMFEVWVGGFYTTTRWMVFEGCFKITPDDTNKFTILIVKDNNDAIKTCSKFCSAYDVFTFQGNWCFCFDNDQHNTYNLRIDSRYCNSKCTCDNKKWYQGYRHVKGNFVPREDSNQSLTRSIEKRRNYLPIVFDAVHSDSCVNQRCAGIKRIRYIQWTNQWTFERVCDYFLNYSTKCVLARKKKGKDVELVEEPCTNLHPAACENDNLHTLRYCPGIARYTSTVTTTMTPTKPTTTSISTIGTNQPSTSPFTSKSASLSTLLTTLSDNHSNEMTSTDPKLTSILTTQTRTVISDLSMTTDQLATENRTAVNKTVSKWTRFNLVMYLSVVLGVILGIPLIVVVVHFVRRFILYRQFYQECRYTEVLRAQAQVYSELGHIYEEISDLNSPGLVTGASNGDDTLSTLHRKSQPNDMKKDEAAYLNSHSYRNMLIFKQVFSGEKTSNIQNRINQKRTERTKQDAQYGISRNETLLNTNRGSQD